MRPRDDSALSLLHSADGLRSDSDVEQAKGLERSQSVGLAHANSIAYPHSHALLSTVLLFKSSGRGTVCLSGSLYSTTSAALILLNKHVLASYGFSAPISLLCFHCWLSIACVSVTQSVTGARVEPLTWPLIKLWVPVNVLFVGMLLTSFYALTSLGVGMFTLLKNMSNIFTVMGDWALYRRTYSWHVWACLLVMVASAACGGYTDLQFNITGYAWQLLNCLFTAAYSLSLFGLSERTQEYTGDSQRMSLLSMVYCNNMLSLPVLAGLAVAFEFPGVFEQQALANPYFLVYAVLGGLLGFLISFSSMWYVSTTTATLYSLTGSLNKAIVAGVGIMIFHEKTTVENLSSLIVGLVSSALLPFAKQRQSLC